MATTTIATLTYRRQLYDRYSIPIGIGMITFSIGLFVGFYRITPSMTMKIIMASWVVRTAAIVSSAVGLIVAGAAINYFDVYIPSQLKALKSTS